LQLLIKESKTTLEVYKKKSALEVIIDI